MNYFSLLLFVFFAFVACTCHVQACNNFVDVQPGLYHTCALKKDNTVDCFGGYDENSNKITAPSTKFKQISSGREYTCGLTLDTSAVECWGNINIAIDYTPISGIFEKFFAGRYHACGIRYDQTVKCFGNNSYGQSYPPHDALFVQLALGDQHTCGLKVDGSITCWGRWDLNQLIYPASYNNSMVFVGGDFSCGVLQSTGKHVCVGSDLSYAYSTLPLIQYDVLSAGYDTICGIRADTKSLVCSGNNEDGRVTPPSGSFITVSVNARHACAITTNHTIVCWGTNTHRQTETQPCECPGLCYSHGLCLDNGSCICDNHFNSLTACSQCDAGYFGEHCSGFTCFGKNNTHPDVCSGHGVCTDIETCTCDVGFYGATCELQRQCQWDSSQFGAPTPVVSTQWNNNEVIYEVTMINHPEKEHFITLSSFVPGHFQEYLQKTNYAVNSTDLTECNKKYSFNVAWSDSSVSQTYNQATETTQLLSKIFISYIDRANQQVVSFEATQVTYVKMASDAVAVVDVAQGEVLRYSSNFIYQQNGMIIAGSSIRLGNGYTLSSLQLSYSSIGPVFTLAYSKLDNSTYDISLYTKPGVQSVKGSYQLRATLLYSGVLVNYTIPFEINYVVIIPPPPANLTFTTDVFLSESILGAPKTNYEYSDRAYVTTSLREYGPQLSSFQLLKLKNAYVCCMKNNAAMPSYNPSNKQYGCTVNDPATMERWIQLVKSAVPSSIARLETSISPDRTVFSFDVSPLTDKRRTCYLHVTTLVSTSGARSLAGALDGEEEKSEGYSLLTVEKSSIATSAGTEFRSSNVMLLIAAIICFLFIW